MSLNHLLEKKELVIKTITLESDKVECENIESNQVFTKGYGTESFAVDTSFSTYAIVSEPRFTGATLYFSKCLDAILPVPPDSPGMYDVISGKSCIITRSGNCATQKFNFTATRTASDAGTDGLCELYFILNNKNPIDSSTYSYTFNAYSITSNGYSLLANSPTITTKSEAGNTYGTLQFIWNKNAQGFVAPGPAEQYNVQLEVSWLENPITP